MQRIWDIKYDLLHLPRGLFSDATLMVFTLAHSCFMFPYDRRLLRCHPYWVQSKSPITDGEIHTKSNRHLFWKCCECDCVFHAITYNLTVSSCRCSEHSKALRTRTRPRYDGYIPAHITQPIRTGLLQSVDGQALLDLVASLLQGDNPYSVARSYIDEVSRVSDARLLDGGFWWDDGCQRKAGIRYCNRPIRQKRMAPYDKKDSGQGPVHGVDPHWLSSDRQHNEVVVYDAEAVSIWDDVIAKCRGTPNAIFHHWVSDVVPVLGIPWPPMKGVLTEQQQVRVAYLLLWVLWGALFLCGHFRVHQLTLEKPYGCLCKNNLLWPHKNTRPQVAQTDDESSAAVDSDPRIENGKVRRIRRVQIVASDSG